MQLGWIYSHLSKAVATTKGAKLRQASKQLSESKVRNGRDLECKNVKLDIQIF